MAENTYRELKMNQTLLHFSSALRSGQNNALDALLKIAEAKNTMLIWQEEVAAAKSQGVLDVDPRFIAINFALAQVDRAEESVLAAFVSNNGTASDV
jgi:hypothetical protein